MLSIKLSIPIFLSASHSSITLIVCRTNLLSDLAFEPLCEFAYIMCVHSPAVYHGFSQCVMKVQLYFPIFVVLNLTNTFSESPRKLPPAFSVSSSRATRVAGFSFF